MFRFYLPRLYKTTSFLFSGNSTTTLCFHETSFLIRSFCVNSATDESSFTVSYLIKSCGLSEEKAISVSKKIQLKRSSQPDTVLTLLNHEFPNSHVFKIIEKHPSILRSDPNKTLKPKIEFFKSLGLSGLEVANLLLKAPLILHRSLEKTMMPSVVFLKSILLTESNITSMIKQSPWIFAHDPRKRLEPNIALLRSHGVPNHNILKLLEWSPDNLVWITPKRLKVVTEKAKELQFDPSKFVFLRAIQGLTCMNSSSWEAKTHIYKSWGWSDEDILMAFRKQPQCMIQSKKKISGCMEFIVNKMGYNSLFIANRPLLLMYSLEKRTIPRLSVIRVLISNNLLKKDCNINTVMQRSDEVFLKEFVTKFEEQLPQLLDVYKGKKNAHQPLV